MFAITLRARGTIEWIQVRNTDGQFSVWDTRPETGNWALGVTRYDKTVLNKIDGSVRFNVSDRIDLYLLVADNGSLKAGKTNYQVRIRFTDERILERNVSSSSGQSPPAITQPAAPGRACLPELVRHRVPEAVLTGTTRG